MLILEVPGGRQPKECESSSECQSDNCDCLSAVNRSKSTKINMVNVFAEAAALVAVAATLLVHNLEDENHRIHENRRKRKQRDQSTEPSRGLPKWSVEDIYVSIGSLAFRRDHRMSYESFWKLHSKLDQAIARIANYSQATKKQRTPTIIIEGGLIPTSVRLSCALRYFAGASVSDLMTTYGISSDKDVMESVLVVVDAVNKYKKFGIQYPKSHEKQRSIAAEFRNKSTADFDNCAGAIDGILIWIHPPSKSEAAVAGIGRGLLYCEKKEKFGLNCQVVADCQGRILDISITTGGGTSDCYAFESGKLWGRLEHGLLAPGLVLFGDNAYLNSAYMATPFRNVAQGSKHDYNYFHSQLQLRVQCAFGMLVNRWAILRTMIPEPISIRETVALVNALARLHNFCLDENEALLELSSSDMSNLVNKPEGYVVCEPRDGCEVTIPRPLLDGSNHFADVPRPCRRSVENRIPGGVQPRTVLLQKVIDAQLVRPIITR